MQTIQRLPAGVPKLAEYQTLVTSDAFRTLEAFASRFLAANRGALASYAEKWVADPLHQWSRQWEYPFVLAELEAHADALHEATASSAGVFQVLDAGSGATFFPFVVTERIVDASVLCCDRDAGLASTFAALAGGRAGAVTFRACGLDAVPCADAAFDAVACISVLEHCDNHPAILDEFRRVLRPGGLLIVTIDVSRDGKCDIAPDAAAELISGIEARFEPADSASGARLLADLRSPDALTTLWAKRARPKLLPWKRSLLGRVRDLTRGRAPVVPFYDCTVFCASYRRRP